METASCEESWGYEKSSWCGENTCWKSTGLIFEALNAGPLFWGRSSHFGRSLFAIIALLSHLFPCSLRAQLSSIEFSPWDLLSWGRRQIYCVYRDSDRKTEILTKERKIKHSPDQEIPQVNRMQSQSGLSHVWEEPSGDGVNWEQRKAAIRKVWWQASKKSAPPSYYLFR